MELLIGLLALLILAVTSFRFGADSTALGRMSQRRPELVSNRDAHVFDAALAYSTRAQRRSRQLELST